MSKCPLCKAPGFTPPKKRGVGRPSALTPEVKEKILNEIKMGATYTDAAQLAGLSPATIGQWIEKGRAGTKKEYVEFVRELDLARVERRRFFRTQILTTSKAKGDWRGTAFIATVTEREHFAQRVHIVVEEQLKSAVERLEREFSGEGEQQLLERALGALAGEDRISTTAGSSAFKSGDLLDAGEGVDPASTIAASTRIPGTDV
jgi:hypothetical protein